MNANSNAVVTIERGTAPEATRTELRPRYEGSNICTWIGFKHVNFMVEEAVLDHLRQRGFPAGALYERYGLCTDISTIDTKILTAFHIDDLAVAEVRPVAGPGSGMSFEVELTVRRAEQVKAVTAKVTVSFRADDRGLPAEPVPAELAEHVVAELGRPAEAVEVGDRDPIELLTEGANAFGWAWRMPYFYCHFTERVQMSGYLRQMEEVVDLFLADRGVSIKKLLDEQDWIPVVPHSRIELLGEARMEEELYTIFTVERVFKRLTYTARMDCYVLRDGVLVPTATGRITHGYAVIDNRRDWSLVDFDDQMLAALGGGSGSAAGRGR